MASSGSSSYFTLSHGISLKNPTVFSPDVVKTRSALPPRVALAASHFSPPATRLLQGLPFPSPACMKLGGAQGLSSGRSAGRAPGGRWGDGSCHKSTLRCSRWCHFSSNHWGLIRNRCNVIKMNFSHLQKPHGANSVDSLASLLLPALACLSAQRHVWAHVWGVFPRMPTWGRELFL